MNHLPKPPIPLLSHLVRSRLLRVSLLPTPRFSPSFSSFRECRICGNAPPAEDPKGDAPGTRQAGYGTACAEWEMEKSKRTVRHGQYFAGCHNQKAGLGRTVHCDTRIVPGRNADRDCGACKARDGAGAGTASCAAAPLHTVSRTGRPGLSAGDPDIGNDSCDRTYSQAHKRTADCAWRRK